MYGPSYSIDFQKVNFMHFFYIVAQGFRPANKKPFNENLLRAAALFPQPISPLILSNLKGLSLLRYKAFRPLLFWQYPLLLPLYSR